MFISSFADYLVRPSPLLDDITVRLHVHDLVRPFSDKLVWSSYVYGLAGLYSLKLGTAVCFVLFLRILSVPLLTAPYPFLQIRPIRLWDAAARHVRGLHALPPAEGSGVLQF